MAAVTTLAMSRLAGCGSSGGDADTSSAGSSEATGTETTDSSGGISTEIDMSEEPYTVAIQVVTLPGTQFEGEAEREAAINAITESAINCTVDIQEVWISEIANTTSMAVAGGEKVDLVHVATVSPLSSMVGSDILYDMNTDNLLQNRGQDLETLFGDLLKSGYVNGQQLAIPAKNFNASAKGIYYNKTMADEYGITLPETGGMDELETALKAIHEANADVYPFYVGDGVNNYLYWLQGYEGFGQLAAYGAVLDSSADTTIENLYASDAFKDFAMRMYNWRTLGLLPGDPTDTNTAQDYFNSSKLFAVVSDISEKTMVDARASAEAAGIEVGFMQMVEPKVTNSSLTEYMWGIASNSERPDKAMDFLNYMYSNADVANILLYGLENTNYNFVEGSTDIVAINGSYLPLFFVGGNMESIYIKSPAGEDYIEKTLAMESAAVVSPITNYMFSDADFATEASVINTTLLEYLPRIQNGMAESEEATVALLDEFNQKLSASGMDDVITANQAQLDTWLAAQ
ncbi:MAG: extracellular solute-binding protein [Lachnospiraceae bacterium]